MSNNVSTNELRATWESAAPGWAKWESEFTRNLVDATGTLFDHVNMTAGMRVLDLACGAGSQTLMAARRIGEGGSVVACDISDKMLRHTRENADRAGLSNIETRRSAAEDLSGEGGQFDAAYSRLGLMLFAAPKTALAALHGVLKPGGRFAALVFSTPDRNPYQAEPMKILLRHAGAPPPRPGQPGIFALGGPGVLEALLRESGFADIELATVRAPFQVASVDDALAFMQQAAGAYRAVIADLSEAGKAAAWAEVRDGLEKFKTASGFEVEMEFIIGSGAVPA